MEQPAPCAGDRGARERVSCRAPPTNRACSNPRRPPAPNPRGERQSRFRSSGLQPPNRTRSGASLAPDRPRAFWLDGPSGPCLSAPEIAPGSLARHGWGTVWGVLPSRRFAGNPSRSKPSSSTYSRGNTWHPRTTPRTPNRSRFPSARWTCPPHASALPAVRQRAVARTPAAPAMTIRRRTGASPRTSAAALVAADVGAASRPRAKQSPASTRRPRPVPTPSSRPRPATRSSPRRAAKMGAETRPPPPSPARRGPVVAVAAVAVGVGDPTIRTAGPRPGAGAPVAVAVKVKVRGSPPREPPRESPRRSPAW